MSDDDECCVYTIRKRHPGGPIIYVGMTAHVRARAKSHKKVGPVAKFIEKNPGVKLYISIEHRAPRHKAQVLERELIQKHAHRPSLLNLAHNAKKRTQVRWEAYMQSKKTRRSG